MGWLIGLAVVVIVVVVVVRSRSDDSDAASGTTGSSQGGCAYPGDPDDPPPTPSQEDWSTRGPGYRGQWTTAPDTLVTLTSDDFVWESHWVTAGLDIQPGRAQGRAIIFRLVDNPKVKITGVTGGGVAAHDGRSAYSCCDADGEITVTVHAEAGAAHEGAGGLWAIDVGVGSEGEGRLTRFEVRTP